MRIQKRSKKNSPRVYITLKDAVTKEIRGVTVQDANLAQVLKRLDDAFSGNANKQPIAA